MPISALVRVMGSAVFYDSSAGRFYHMAAYFQDTSKFRFAIDNASAATLGNSVPAVPGACDAIIVQGTHESA